MTSEVRLRRRNGASKSAEETSRMTQPTDLRQVTVLSKAEWLRIQDELNQVNREKERLREAAKQREALHLQSKEAVKQWSNTIAGQRQKKLEAKKIREQKEEEKRKLIDIEEAKYHEQKRIEAIEKAKAQLYYQTDRVKGLHRALLLSEVLKEREAQIEMKQRIKSATKNVDRGYLEMVKTREDEALRQEQEAAQQKKLKRETIAKDLKNQIKEMESLRERQKSDNRREGKEIQRLHECYLWEQRMDDERRIEQKRNLMQAHQEQLTNRDLMRAVDTQNQQADEEKRKLFVSAKQKMTKLRKDREAEIFREAQMQRERIMNKLAVKQKEQIDNEEERIAKAVAERDAKQAQLQREEEEKRASMLKSITAHREFMRKEKEQRDKEAQQKARYLLQAKAEADKIFSKKQQLKAQRIREEARNLQDFNAAQMAEKTAKIQQLRREEHDFEAKNAHLVAEEEKQFQHYSHQVISAAAEAQRNLVPLFKAAREGSGGGLGPVVNGIRPSYLVQDRSGAELPKYISAATLNVKKLNESVDIQEAKMRLGFTWA